MTEKPTVVWTEIPVTDLKAACKFYAEVFDWTMTIRTDMGPQPMADFNGANQSVAGHLYTGKPASGNGPTIHLAVPDKLESAAQRCEAAGGRLVGEPVQIPPGRFQYASDPDGNSLGLFEPAAA